MTRASISVVLVRPLAVALAPYAAALADLLARSDLTAEMLADSEARVSPAQFCVAWAEAIRASDDPALAIRIAESTPPGSFGVVEYVCRSAPTLRAALEHWCRYLGILDDAVDVGLVDEDDVTALRVLRESEAPAPASHELCFALVVARAREVSPVRVREVRYEHRASDANAARQRAFFDAPVRFGARATELVFDRAALDAPLASADAGLHEVLRGAADEKRAKRSPHAPLTDQVRRALATALQSDDAQLDVVAKRLGTTGRSLQRRLKDEGTSFQAVRETMRRELADRYLGEGLTFAEISFLLGFSEPSAFFRAFKRWTGLTPFERRASLLASPIRTS
ncbi:MAG TPA: AraC family transcriptional regulator [Polyangiaceae bacterium]